MHCSRRLIVQTLVFSRSYLHRQVSPTETLVVKGGTTLARNGRLILPENARLPRNIQGSFTCRKSTTWEKRLYFPSEGRRAEDFFALKNSTASVGFEPKASTLPLDHRSRYFQGKKKIRTWTLHVSPEYAYLHTRLHRNTSIFTATLSSNFNPPFTI